MKLPLATALTYRTLDGCKHFDVLRYRGGSILRHFPPHFVHSVILGLVANSVAVMLTHTLTDLVPISVRSVSQRRVLAGLINCLVGFVCFFIVYLLTGFVPMGYVSGTEPLFSWFKPECT